MIKQFRIIIGNNSPEFGSVYKDYLTGEGFSVTLTENHDGMLLSEIFNLKPKVVVIDADMNSSAIDSKTILSIICNMKMNRPKTIVIGKDERKRKEMLALGADDFLIRPFQFDDLRQAITNLLPTEIHQQKERKIRFVPKSRKDYLSQLLFSFGAQTKMLGFHQTIDAILLYLDGFKMITKEIYPALAKKYSATQSSIEHNIRSFVSNICENEHSAELNCLLTVYRKNDKMPSNLQFISLIATYLQLEKEA